VGVLLSRHLKKENKEEKKEEKKEEGKKEKNTEKKKRIKKKKKKKSFFIFLWPSFFSSAKMASSSSNNNNNNGVPLTTQIDWYKIRDTFFGRNCASQNIPLALKLAASCDHPDARWLAAVCAGKEVETEKDARRVFSALGLDDARALCFAWLLGDQEDPHPLLRSVELGFGFAAAEAAFETEKEERFKLAQLAASLGERDGFFLLGVSLRDREARDQDLGKVKENLLRASRLGHVAATCQLGELFEESDPQVKEFLCWWA
jgi:hypothetical protein